MIKESNGWNTIEDYVDKDGKKHNVATTRNIFSKYPNIFIVSFDKKSFVKIEKNLNEKEVSSKKDRFLLRGFHNH